MIPTPLEEAKRLRTRFSTKYDTLVFISEIKKLMFDKAENPIYTKEFWDLVAVEVEKL
jgi:hypothetical protein